MKSSDLLTLSSPCRCRQIYLWREILLDGHGRMPLFIDVCYSEKTILLLIIETHLHGKGVIL